MFRIALLSLLCVLGGCTKAQLDHQSDSFNRAAAATISEQVLLNAVRSSLDLPLSFTKLKAFTAGNMASGSLLPKLPFGPNATRAYDLGPTLSWSSGVQTIEYVDVNTGTALAKLNETLRFDVIDRYALQNINIFLLSTLFVNLVEVHSDLKHAFDVQYRRVCGNGMPTRPKVCYERERLAAACRAKWRDVTAVLEKGQVYHRYDNSAGTKCEFMKFQDLMWLLRVTGFTTELGSVPTIEKLKTPEGKVVAVETSRPVQAIKFQVRQVQDVYERLEAGRRRKGKSKLVGRPPMKFGYRSPKALLTYLGELIALQEFSREAYVPEIVLGPSESIAVFRVMRSHVSQADVALSVRGPYGEVYSVPRPEYGSPTRDQTLRVLAIVGEVVNAAISEKDFPVPTTVLVRSIQ
jgi:hypothetical protein